MIPQLDTMKREGSEDPNNATVSVLSRTTDPKFPVPDEVSGHLI